MSGARPDRGRPFARPTERGRPNVREPGQRTTATPTSDRLADATWPEVEATTSCPETTPRTPLGTTGPATTLLVPLGATEQHGPHLPLGTDATIAAALAEGAAARTPGTLVAPVLPYGSSGEHQDFPGTLSIGAEATELVLVELGRSATETFDRVVFVNAHGGNAAPLAAAVARLRDEGRDVRAWSPRFGGDAHAGRTETSLMLALAEPPERGRPDQPPSARGRPNPPIGPLRTTAVRGELAEAGNAAPLGGLIDRLRAEGVRAVAPNGVLGDPAGASAAEGRALLDAAVEDLIAALATWPAASAPALGARS